MALSWPSKDPGDVLPYEIDWTARLAGDLIATSLYTLTDAAGVTIDSQSNTDDTATVWISGGTDGDTAIIVDTITTVGGLTLVETVLLPIISSADTPELPTTSTKRQIVEMVFEEAGLTGDEFDHTPEESATVMRRMDGMMGELKLQGIDLGYNFPAIFGGGDLSDALGIPDETINTMAIWVALRAFPALGKTMTAESRLAFTQGMIAIRAAYAVIPERSLPAATIRGAGAKPWSTWWPFNPGPETQDTAA